MKEEEDKPEETKERQWTHSSSTGFVLKEISLARCQQGEERKKEQREETLHCLKVDPTASSLPAILKSFHNLNLELMKSAVHPVKRGVLTHRTTSKVQMSDTAG